MCTELPPTHSERVTMTLLCDIEPVVAQALNSLGSHMTKRMEDMYYFYAAKHIHDTLDAFIVLRAQHRLDGSRLLVRPALETMLKLPAVRAKPELLHRARSWRTTRKWTNGFLRSPDGTTCPIRQFPSGRNGQLSEHVLRRSLELRISKMAHHSPHITQQKPSASNHIMTPILGASATTHMDFWKRSVALWIS